MSVNQTSKLYDAINQVTIEMLKNLANGDELELTPKYKLYRYLEDDVIVLLEGDDYNHVCQFLYNEEDEQIEVVDL
jgi:hypothetical protein